MRLKNKAGLALALAAIFTGGPASAVLAADYVTINGDGSSIVTPDRWSRDEPDKQVRLTNVRPDNGSVTLDLVNNSSVELWYSNLVIEANSGADVNSLLITGVNGTLGLAGNGGELITAGGQAVENINLGDKSGLRLGYRNVDRSEQSGAIRNVNFGAPPPSSGIIFRAPRSDSYLDVINGVFSAENVTAVNGNGRISVSNADFTVNSIQADENHRIEIELKSEAKDDYITFIVKNNADLGYGSTYTEAKGWGGNNAIRQIYMGDFKGSMILTENSLTTIGTSEVNALDRIFDSLGVGLSKTGTDGGFLSALGIFSPQTIAVDASYSISGIDKYGLDSDIDTLAIYSDNSLLVLDASSGVPLTFEAAAGGVVEFSYSNKNVDMQARDNSLYVIGARAGANTALISNIKTIRYAEYIESTDTTIRTKIPVDQFLSDMAALNNWTWDGKDGTLFFSSPLLTNGRITVTGPDDHLTIGVTAEALSAGSVYGNFQSGGARLVDGLYGGSANSDMGRLFNAAGSITGYSAGVQLVSRATDNSYTTPGDAAKTIEGAAQMAVSGGAPGLLNTFANVMGDVIGAKYSMMGDMLATAAGSEPGGFGIWVNPYYRSVDVDGMSAGHFKTGYDADFGGVVLGLDYNVGESLRLGLGLNIGGGDSESQGDFYKTDNDFDFWGLSLFGSYTFGAWGLTADLGYTSSSNDITQKLPAAYELGRLKADVDAKAFTVGLTGEYLIELESMKLMPHLGLRYTSLKTDDYDVKAGGGLGKVFSIESERQNVWSVPVGLTLSQSYLTEGGWTITPKADLGAIFSFGDTEVDTTARVFGTGARGTMSADVIDKAVFNGTLGIKAAAANGLSLGLDYNLQASGDTTSHGFSGMLRFEF
ncbi:hypothetical protein C4J81_19020 (plasmid) [Deltaproteobacteria bacterium Smac51]|nr:hypothetical protein C4J81_19020 [Deltaproteobacteria bacterium Smac51]